jgi:hypothetical protein
LKLSAFNSAECQASHDVALHGQHENRRRQNDGQKPCGHEPELDALDVFNSGDNNRYRLSIFN